MTPGQQISRYRIQRPLGKGGMGVVYLAEDTKLNRPVALKFLSSDSFTEQEKQRFLNEARAAASIRHPNICPIHDIEETDGRLFLSMAYLEGETLGSRLTRGPIPVQEAAGIAVQVARGLAKAHAVGIVHRDIKSSNIILAPDGHVSILDFGLALLPGAERLTATGVAIGTPVFMSPEQCEGRELDRRTDIWSLGVVLFEMLTGGVPFFKGQGVATAHAILHDPVPSLSSLRPDVPPELQRVVEKSLAKRLEQRWQSARDLEIALQPFAPDTRRSVVPDEETRTMHVAVSSVGSGGPSRRNIRVAAIGVGVVLLGAAGLLGYKWANTPRTTTETPVVTKPQGAREKLVAILPLQIPGSNAETAEIANGVTEIMTARLADFERLDNSIAAIPGSEIQRRNINSAAEARRIYGANLVVTGTAMPLGTKLQLALALEDTAQSRQVATKAIDYDPADPVGSSQRLVEGLAALLSVDPASARQSASGGETSTPAASTSYLKGRGYLARFDVAGNLDRAIELFERAVKLDPQYALAQAALGEALWRKSRPSGDAALAARALEHAERAVQLDPTLPTLRTSLAAIYTTRGREDDAIRELKEALKLAPGSAAANRELARVYTAKGRFPEAEKAYQEAIAARPTDWYGHLLLGLLYNERLESAKAIAEFQKARELTPDNELVYRNLGVTYMGIGKYEEAVRELQHSLNIKPNATTYASLGAAHFRQRRYPDALAAVETAIDLDAKRYYFWGNLGIYCKWNPGSQGRARPALDKAIQLAREFLAVSPRDYDVRADLGEYYARLGNKEKALAEVEQIPEPARPSRASRIAIVYELTGNRAKAISFLAASVKNPAAWHDIQDDPDLAGLWADPAVQKLRSGQ